MLSGIQIMRLLQHCENIEENYEEIEESGDVVIGKEERAMNQGWIQALRLVVENDTYPISKAPVKEKLPVEE